ncbi:hypothetical protein ACFXKC_45090 [Streptomyces sp. NPDC059340]|uniref:hypothetical protein n=1 Tax=Streptomyces sp. NPDC059340 TaxID=3346806 RepID=UPI0036A7A329
MIDAPRLDPQADKSWRAAPVADGWADRVGLRQFFPLPVHAVLFGRGYAEQALKTARAAFAR